MRSTDNKLKLPRANADINHTTWVERRFVACFPFSSYFQPDPAPKFYPVLSSLRPPDLHGRAELATRRRPASETLHRQCSDRAEDFCLASRSRHLHLNDYTPLRAQSARIFGHLSGTVVGTIRKIVLMSAVCRHRSVMLNDRRGGCAR